MGQQILAVIKTARPRQSLKNLAIFAALLFTGSFFNTELLAKTILGFFLLSLHVSSIYFINDIVDAPKDRLHPFKKYRPIAKGDIGTGSALFLALLGITVSLYGSILVSGFFFFALLAYLVLQIAYTFWLKSIVVLDILAIAAGFILRVYAGAFLIDAHLSVWFLLCVVSASLFLAAGKRRAELGVLTESVAAKHRSTLSLYRPQLLDSYLAMFATASWISWALFTFFKEGEREFFIAEALSPNIIGDIPLTILGSGKLLMITIPLVIFGVMRYLYIVYEGSKAESPERVLTNDRQLRTVVFLWLLIVFTVLYGFRS